MKENEVIKTFSLNSVEFWMFYNFFHSEWDRLLLVAGVFGHSSLSIRSNQCHFIDFLLTIIFFNVYGSHFQIMQQLTNASWSSRCIFYAFQWSSARLRHMVFDGRLDRGWICCRSGKTFPDTENYAKSKDQYYDENESDYHIRHCTLCQNDYFIRKISIIENFI